MPAFVTYTVKDEKGNSSVMNMNIPTATTAANAITFAQSFAGLLNAVITGQITAIGLGYLVTLPGGLRTSPLGGSDVEEGARFSFRTALNHLTRFRIPTFDESLILAGSKAVDLEDTAVDALVDAMTGGLGGVSPVDSRDEDVVSLDAAQEQFGQDRG